MERILKRTLERYGAELMIEVSEKYKIDKSELLRMINVEVEEVKEVKIEKVSKVVMPFVGVKIEGCCDGIRLNHGLYTQCQNKELKNHKDKMLCKTCKNQTEKNSNGETTYGYIQDRIRLGKDYRDPKGKEAVRYGNVLEKLKISRKEAEEEAKRLGIEINEEEFEVKKGQRGRPKKETTTVDTSSEEGSEISDKPKRGRGRPKKEKETVIETTEIEERDKEIDSLFDESNNSSDEEELAVVQFEYKGKKYLKAADNTLYDIKTHEEVGMWDSGTGKVIET